jgi:outer membrane protein assembly factor BamB
MRPRLWPVFLVLGAAALWLAYTWTVSDAIRQWRMVRTWVTVLLVVAALTVWLAFLSRLPARVRWRGAGAVVLAAAAFAALFRARGVTGDLVPVFEPRWSRPAAAPSPAPAAPAVEAISPPPVAGAVTPALAPVAPPPVAAGVPPPETAPAVASADWPQFQGPRRDATVTGVRLFRDWAARPPRLLWRQPVGEGWSGFAVSGGVAVTQEQRGSEERVIALDAASGRLLWAHADSARYATVIAGVGPRATPSIRDGRVFTQGATGLLNALDLATGRRLWSHDLVAEASASMPEWGRSGSPLVLGDRVIVSVGGPSGRSLAAYDARSGALLWSGGEGAASYSSPVRLTLAGREQVVVLNQGSVAGHDPATGAVLWQTDYPAGQPNVAAPVAVDADRLVVSSGYGVGSKAYRVTAESVPVLLWETPRLKSKFANLVVHDGYVYGLDDGVLTCIDPASGERTWKEGRYGHGQILLVGGLLLVQSEDGELVLVEADPRQHRELARFAAFDGKTWNPPALAGRLLLLRNDREAAAFELPVE